MANYFKTDHFIKRLIKEDFPKGYKCWDCGKFKWKSGFKIIGRKFCICKQCYAEYKKRNL